MHIPDGFLDAKTAVATTALSVAGVSFALHRVRHTLPPKKVPLLGLSAAFLFAAQMVNFPVFGGTSGHLIGSVLVAALLGPAAAVVVVTTVLIVQCLVFADGGITALGANVFNMGLTATIVGSSVFALLTRVLPGRRGQVTAIAFAGWFATVLAAIACAGELAASGTIGWRVAFPAMTGIHAIIGLGEGALSAVVYMAVVRTRPDLAPIRSVPAASSSFPDFVGLGLLVTLGIVLFVAPFASPWPDGLEAVASRLGFSHRAGTPLVAAPVADYHLPFLGASRVSVAVAGLIGCVTVFGLALLLSRALVAKHDSAADSAS